MTYQGDKLAPCQSPQVDSSFQELEEVKPETPSWLPLPAAASLIGASEPNFSKFTLAASLLEASQVLRCPCRRRCLLQTWSRPLLQEALVSFKTVMWAFRALPAAGLLRF